MCVCVCIFFQRKRPVGFIRLWEDAQRVNNHGIVPSGHRGRELLASCPTSCFEWDASLSLVSGQPRPSLPILGSISLKVTSTGMLLRPGLHPAPTPSSASSQKTVTVVCSYDYAIPPDWVPAEVGLGFISLTHPECLVHRRCSTKCLLCIEWINPGGLSTPIKSISFSALSLQLYSLPSPYFTVMH